MVKNIVLKIISVLLLFYLEVCVSKTKRAKLNLRTKIFDGGGHGVMALCFTRGRCVYSCAGSLSGKSGILLKFLGLGLSPSVLRGTRGPPGTRGLGTYG